VTPQVAVENGVNYVVMGRPILEAEDKIGAVRQFFNETKEIQYQACSNYTFEKILYTGDWKDILSYIGAFYFRPD